MRLISTSGSLNGLILMSCVLFVVVSLIHTYSELSLGNCLHAKQSMGMKCNRKQDSSKLDVTNVNLKERGTHIHCAEDKTRHEREVCNKHTIESNFILDERVSICYCEISKCASTSIDKFLEYYRIDKRQCQKTKNHENSTRRSLGRNTYSFMFVRDPYARLFSIYETYFFHPSNYWDSIGKDIIQTVRLNATSKRTYLGHDVIFAELVQYVVTVHEQHSPTSSILAPMYTSCNPCKKKFDYIGKLETMSEDLACLVNDWIRKGLLHNNTFPTQEVESEINYRLSLGWIEKMYQMYNKYKSSISHFKLLQRFWSSSQIRGKISKYYEIPYFKDDSEIDEMAFKRSFQSALYASKSNKDELKAQRQEALVQAYRSVPIELREKLKQVLTHDCLMFGYDDQPAYLFDRRVNSETSQTFHDYFESL